MGSLVLLLTAIIDSASISLFRMSSMNSMLRWILLALAIVLTLSETSAKPAASAEGGQPGEINSALNYLAELDKYYSNVARPRFGKRSSPTLGIGSRSPYEIYIPSLHVPRHSKTYRTLEDMVIKGRSNLKDLMTIFRTIY